MLIFLLYKFQACQCYGHATECFYNSTVDSLKMSIDIHGKYEGGGVCVGCQVNIKFKSYKLFNLQFRINLIFVKYFKGQHCWYKLRKMCIRLLQKTQ